MAEAPKLFDCERLHARISVKQCLLNWSRAQVLKEHGHGIGLLYPCLNCKKGRTVKAYFPGER